MAPKDSLAEGQHNHRVTSNL